MADNARRDTPARLARNAGWWSGGRAHVAEDEAVAFQGRTGDDGDRRAESGQSHTNVWNSPFSPQGSAPDGNSARSSSSQGRPASSAGTCEGSTQVTTALTPASSISWARTSVGRSQSGKRARTPSPRAPARVRADVREEEITEDDLVDSSIGGLCKCTAHRVLVAVVGARRRQFNEMQWQSESFSLRGHQGSAHCVHRHAIRRCIHRDEEADDLHVAFLSHRSECERTVLAAAPTHPGTAHGTIQCEIWTLPTRRAYRGATVPPNAGSMTE